MIPAIPKIDDPKKYGDFDLPREKTVRACDDVAHIRDNQFGFRAGKVRHGSQRDQTDEHRAAPDDDLEEGREECHLALVLQARAVIARAHKDLRQQQRVAERARERIADARRIGAHADRTRIGEPVRRLHADGLERLDDGAVEHDLERYENDRPQRQNEKPALYGIRQRGGRRKNHHARRKRSYSVARQSAYLRRRERRCLSGHNGRT